MADEIDDSKSQDPQLQNPNPSPNPKSPSSASFSLSLNIWPPTQRTRDAVTARLVETLTCPSSVLAKRYGVLPEAEAASVAGEIEKEAYDAAESASDEAKAASVEGGIEILEIYSKAISRKMLESVKASGGVQNLSPPAIENLSVEDAEKESLGGESAEAEAAP